jgi:hypothetical protein
MIAAMTVFVVLVGAAAYQRHERLKAEVFDGEAWRDVARIDEGIRLSMADGLIARGDLLGMRREEVVRMLGEPPPPEYFAKWDMVYRLGMERSIFSIDSEWLVIRLNSSGRVAEYQIERD